MPNHHNLRFCLIQTANIKFIWEFVSGLIAKALKHAFGKFTLDDIKNELIAGNMQLWTIVDDDDAIDAVIVTQIVQYPAKKVLLIMFVAGVQFENWINVLHYIKDFAREHGCEAIEGYGRKGWEKKLRPTGFIPIHTVYSLQLKRDEECREYTTGT